MCTDVLGKLTGLRELVLEQLGEGFTDFGLLQLTSLTALSRLELRAWDANEDLILTGFEPGEVAREVLQLCCESWDSQVAAAAAAAAPRQQQRRRRA